MNYIYDVLLNFNETLYEFYDWNKEDKIMNIKKIPLFKTSNNDLLNIINNKVRIDLDFLEKIKNKTVLMKINKTLKYAALFSNDFKVVAVLFDNEGNSILKSNLLLDEEKVILKLNKRNQEIKLNYTILKKETTKLETRKEIETKQFLSKKIDEISNSNEILEYLYYECFNKKETKIEKIIKDLKYFIKDEVISNKLNNFFKITMIDKKK